MKGKGCLRFILYIVLLIFGNIFIEDYLNIYLNGVTKFISIFILGGLFEILFYLVIKNFSIKPNNSLINIKKMVFHKKREKKRRSFYIIKTYVNLA